MNDNLQCLVFLHLTRLMGTENSFGSSFLFLSAVRVSSPFSWLRLDLKVVRSKALVSNWIFLVICLVSTMAPSSLVVSLLAARVTTPAESTSRLRSSGENPLTSTEAEKLSFCSKTMWLVTLLSLMLVTFGDQLKFPAEADRSIFAPPKFKDLI